VFWCYKVVCWVTVSGIRVAIGLQKSQIIPGGWWFGGGSYCLGYLVLGHNWLPYLPKIKSSPVGGGGVTVLVVGLGYLIWYGVALGCLLLNNHSSPVGGGGVMAFLLLIIPP
jgi:hypothetical protein